MANDLYEKEANSGCCFSDHVNDSCLHDQYPSHIGPDLGLEPSCNSLFERNVTFGLSTIHIPNDTRINGKVYTSIMHMHVYINVCLLYVDRDVLCSIQWTSGLGDHFKSQSEGLQYSVFVTYQYFGSRDGVLRFYPGKCGYFLYALYILYILWDVGRYRLVLKICWRSQP